MIFIIGFMPWFYGGLLSPVTKNRMRLHPVFWPVGLIWFAALLLCQMLNK